MSLSDWIISLSAAALGIVISIAAYFAQKWIGTVDDAIKEYSGDLKALTKQISTLESSQAAQTKNISQTIHTQLSSIKLPHSKIDKIEQEVGAIKQTIQEKVLPHQERSQEFYGKITVLEGSMREQNDKLVTMLML